jgi:hypothetical protein
VREAIYQLGPECPEIVTTSLYTIISKFLEANFENPNPNPFTRVVIKNRRVYIIFESKTRREN